MTHNTYFLLTCGAKKLVCQRIPALHSVCVPKTIARRTRRTRHRLKCVLIHQAPHYLSSAYKFGRNSGHFVTIQSQKGLLIREFIKTASAIFENVLGQGWSREQSVTLHEFSFEIMLYRIVIGTTQKKSEFSQQRVRYSTIFLEGGGLLPHPRGR